MQKDENFKCTAIQFEENKAHSHVYQVRNRLSVPNLFLSLL